MDDRIESFLRKAAGRVERGTIPATMSFGDDPGGKYGWELNRILRGRARHESNGRLVVDFAGEVATVEFWKGLGFLDRSDAKFLPRAESSRIRIRHPLRCSCRHGDTDLDGRLIAEQLFAACPGEMVEPPAGASRIPLSETLASGWIEQESWDGLAPAEERR